MKEQVLGLKQRMVAFAKDGKASQLRGIIVSPQLWEQLHEDSEGFHGVMGITGTEGTVTLRYSFYVLKSETFPAEATGGDAFFFVPFTKEEYEEKFIGKETEGFNELIAGIDHAMRYSYVRTLPDPNPPQIWWNRHPELYLYEEALKADSTLKSSVGRLLMKPQPDMRIGEIVGIAIDGYGKIHEVPVPITDFEDFLKKALMDFWPEEVLEFVNTQGGQAEMSLETLRPYMGDPYWGDWVDYEDMGRIQQYYRTGPKGDGHLLSVHCTATRAVVFWLDIAFESNDEKFEAIKSTYFPEDWQDWPVTRQQEALARFAAVFA